MRMKIEKQKTKSCKILLATFYLVYRKASLYKKSASVTFLLHKLRSIYKSKVGPILDHLVATQAVMQAQLLPS